MKGRTITWGVVVGVVVSLAVSMPLWSAQSTKQKELDAEKVEQPKEKLEPLPKTTIRLAGPKINKFSCKSLTKGYNVYLFDGPGFDPNCRLSVNYDIYASRGLQKLEITLGGNRVYEETFGGLRGPAVTSQTRRDLRLNVTSVPIAHSGYYTLQLKVWDLLGNVASDDIRLRCDLELPTIHSIHPTDGETIYRDGGSVDITFEFDVSDDFSGVSSVWMGGLYGSVVDETPPFNITIRNIEHDTGFDIQVLDGEGNVRSDYISVHVTPRPASFHGPDLP